MNNEPVKNMLPEDPTLAAREIIKLSQVLLGLAEREAQLLVQGDLVTFNILQDEKELIITRLSKINKLY